MKKVLSLILTLAMIFALCLPVSAASFSEMEETNSESQWVLKTAESGEEYILNRSSGEIIAKVFSYNEFGELVEMDLSEYLVLKNSLPCVTSRSLNTTGTLSPYKDNTSSSAAKNTWIYDYRETSTTVEFGTPVKVTQDIRGPGKVSHFTSTTIEHSFGGDVSIVGAMKNVIQLGASFDWHISLASETSNGYEFDVPRGYIGYIQFTPYLNVTEGDLYYLYSDILFQDEIYLGEVWGSAPREIEGGFADGLFELILR